MEKVYKKIKMKRKLNKLDSILQYRRSFDIYLAKYFPKVTGSWREQAWIKFAIKKGFADNRLDKEGRIVKFVK